MTTQSAPNNATRFFIVVQLDNASTLQRVSYDVPGIITLLKSCSTGEDVAVFRSNDGVLFGLFVKSDLSQDVIQKRFDASPHTNNKDAILITDVGNATASSLGFSRASTWLKRH